MLKKVIFYIIFFVILTLRSVLSQPNFLLKSSNIAYIIPPERIVLTDGTILSLWQNSLIRRNGIVTNRESLSPGQKVVMRIDPHTYEINLLEAFDPQYSSNSNTKLIHSFTANISKPLKENSHLSIAIKGEPGGKATFDIAAIAYQLPMEEISSGKYTGSYKIPPHLELENTFIIVKLKLPKEEGVLWIKKPLTIYSSNIQLKDFSPGAGEIVELNRPYIYVTFPADSGGRIDPRKLKLFLNGKEVTPISQRSPFYILYKPSAPLKRGKHTVRLIVEDVAGNRMEKSWHFFVEF